mgnify:CR=1 FL=1
MSRNDTVLVVDDEREIVNLYATWLRDEYDVRTVYGGAEALETLESTSIDVALIDRLMPRMTGSELLQRIRENGYDCRVSIVTAVEPDFDIIEMGFDEYPIKPVGREDVRDVVDRLVTRSAYDEQLRDFFALASKRAALEAEKSRTELRASDAYVELTGEFDRLQARIERTVERLRPRDFEVEMRRLDAPTLDD